MTYAMVIDLKRCVGCQACTEACKLEHATPPGILRTKVLKKEFGTFPDVRRFPVPVLCMQCDNAPCEKVCPTGATYIRDDGIVAVDPDLCIGCKACATACPYGARYFREDDKGYFPELTPYEVVGYQKHPVGIMEKCDFCADRLAEGLEPACVQNCLTKSRMFGQLEDFAELIAVRNGCVLKEELGTEPKVYYLP